MLVQTIDIAATAEAPGKARRWLDDCPELRRLGQVAFDVRLLVTELVSNSVRHAGAREDDQVSITLKLSSACVRVEVSDAGDGFVIPERPQKRNADGGRGLQILAAVAHRWGIGRSKPVSVWFEIDLAKEPTPPAGGEGSRAGVRSSVH